MIANTYRYIQALIELELSHPGETNHNIYDKRLRATPPWEPFEEDPHAIYFYFLKFESDNRPKVLHYFWDNGTLNAPGHNNPIPLDRVEAVVQKLAQNAKDNGNDPPPDDPPNINFSGIKWRGVSYIAIVLDEDDWYFDQYGTDTSAIVFNTSKGSTPNHSFFDAKNLYVTVMNNQTHQQETRTAILFINHFKKNAAGDPVMVPADSQEYVFDAYAQVSYSGQADRPLRVVMDPGGTNLGPPLFP